MRIVNCLLWVLWLMWVGGARACRGPAVRISGCAGVQQSFNNEYYGNILDAYYGDNVNIFCSSNDSKNLRITLDDRRHLAGQLTEVNMTTLQLSVEPMIGEYLYTCTNVETTCAVELRVRVTPVITVVSPNVHQKVFAQSGVFHYFVPIDEDYEVICYGNPELEIRDRVQIESINETAIKSEKLNGAEYSTHIYFCAHKASQVTTRNVEVLIDYVPAATNFWCTEYDWQVNCSWSVLSMDTTFTLFNTDINGNLKRIYEDYSGSKKTRRCEWTLRERWSRLPISEKLTLVVQACNPIYCSNQTNIIVRSSIMKTGPPQDLKILKTTSSNAVLTWRGPWQPYYDMPVDYKLIYWASGVPDLSGSSTKITCDHHAMRYLEKCEGELKLPCPDALYVVEVYSKYANTPRENDAYWSEPARTTLRTDPQDSLDAVDPACLKEPELINNNVVAVYEVQKFGRSFRKEGSALHRAVKSMEQKVDKIKRLCRELALDDCEHFGLRVFTTPL